MTYLTVNQALEKICRDRDRRLALDDASVQTKEGLPVTPPHATRLTPIDDLEGVLKKVQGYVVLSSGEYIINSEITIAPGGTLHIEPGTELYFTEEAGITTRGTLKAIGTEQQQIVFTAKDKHWRNIFIHGEHANDTTLQYCHLSKGKARRGGGIFIDKANPTIQYCTIMHNQAEWGGGLHLDRSNPTLKKNTIMHNQAEDLGGGLFLQESEPTLEKNTITNNQAEAGGGLFLRESEPTLKKNSIMHNQAEAGGGLFLHESEPTLENNIIMHNQAESFGGGLFLQESEPTLEKNTITNNQAEYGGGLHLLTSNPTLKENTIENNKPDNIDEIK